MYKKVKTRSLYEVILNECNIKTNQEKLYFNMRWLEQHLKLIEQIKLYPVIYSPRSRQNNWEKEKNQAWENIAMEVGLSVLHCKIRWSNVKKKYYAHRKNLMQLKEPELYFSKHDETLSFLNDEEEAEDDDVIEILDSESDDSSESSRKSNGKTSTTKGNIKSLLSSRNEVPSTSANYNTQQLINRSIDERIQLITYEESTAEDKNASSPKNLNFWAATSSGEDTGTNTKSNAYNKEEEHKEKDIQVFFDELAHFVGEKFSAKKQKEISLRICALLTDAELEELDND